MAVIDISDAVTSKSSEQAKPAGGRANDPAIVELCDEINRLMKRTPERLRVA